MNSDWPYFRKHCGWYCFRVIFLAQFKSSSWLAQLWRSCLCKACFLWGSGHGSTLAIIFVEAFRLALLWEPWCLCIGWQCYVGPFIGVLAYRHYYVAPLMEALAGSSKSKCLRDVCDWLCQCHQGYTWLSGISSQSRCTFPVSFFGLLKVKTCLICNICVPFFPCFYISGWHLVSSGTNYQFSL